MTKGSPLRLIVFFTIPVLLGNIFQNVYNLMDSIIVGRFLGVNALAAVGATGTLTFLVFGWVTGMTGGFGILLAQSFGAGDEKRLRHYTVMSIYLCVAMAVLMTAGLLLANRGILKLMNTPDTILDDTAGYIGIIYAGLPVTIAIQYAFFCEPFPRRQPDPADLPDHFFGAEYHSGYRAHHRDSAGRPGSGLCHRHRPGRFRCGLLLLCKEEI